MYLNVKLFGSGQRLNKKMDHNRITEDGYVEYGLQIPYNIYTR